MDQWVDDGWISGWMDRLMGGWMMGGSVGGWMGWMDRPHGVHAGSGILCSQEKE